MDYGLFCFDKDGNPIDINLDASLIVEGVLFLGNAPSGLIALDMLFPRRNFFKGIFLIPPISRDRELEHRVFEYIKVAKRNIAMGTLFLS